MKVVVVNDCAHVMEDLIPYLSRSFDIEFIQRTRGVWSKTFGVFWRILGAKGDLYHVNYALQDSYFVDKLKHKLDILHVHGSDVRWTIHSAKYGWIVRNNLKNARRVLYATPDLEGIVKRIRPDAIYLPTPIKTDVFVMKNRYNDPLRAIHFVVPYEQLPSELGKYLSKNNISLTVKERNTPYDEMPNLLMNFDIFIDQLTIPSLSKTCLEAMSSGLATIDHRHKHQLSERTSFLSNTSNTEKEGRENRKYVIENHEAKKVAALLSEIWKETMALTR